jgi:Uma2 family endonuclease
MHTTDSSAGKLTYRDLCRMPGDGKRHELIDGVHYVTPSPFTVHQRIVGNLFFLMRSHLETHADGEVFGFPCDIVLTLFDVVVPDLFFVTQERLSIITRKNVAGAPDLVVEVASKSTRRRDDTVKLALYERFGVREYWTIGPESETIRVYRRTGDRLERALELRNESGSMLTSPLLPGMALPVQRIVAG